MSKPSYFHAAERVDLEDFRNVAVDYPTSMRNRMLQIVHGTGVLQGFRVEVLGTKGVVEIYNGIGMDWGGTLINAETGTVSQRLNLSGANREFWIEIEFLWIEADPDARAFFDPTADNPSPIPDGQEVDIPRTMTRLVPSWRVKNPIRNNATGVRVDQATPTPYAPEGFSDSSNLVIPIAVLRTNGAGDIIGGDANTSADGNDIATIKTAGGGTSNVVKVSGYGESDTITVGSKVMRIGTKTTDQRPRLYERLEAPFIFGDTGESLGDGISDHWVRDHKSAYDHIATQIARILHGVETSKYYEGVLLDHDPNWNWVDVNTLSMESTVNPNIPPDHFMFWTFQIRQGPWGGFYAQVYRSSALSSGEYRIYLRNFSSAPSWWPLPDLTTPANRPLIRLVHSRSQNWLERPCPTGGYRGLNALDTEVVEARNDVHSSKTFGSLTQRLDGEKAYELVLGPERNSGTGVGADYELIESSGVPTLASIGTMQTAVGNFVLNTNPAQGGRLLFRKGTYDFQELESASLYTVFSMSNGNSLFIEGPGQKNTVLKFTTPNAANYTLFDMSNCEDVEFRNLTFWGRGEIIQMSGCSNVRFYNCTFISEYTNSLTDHSIDLGSAVDILFDNCTFKVSGRGIYASSMTDVVFRNCTFEGETASSTKSGTMIYCAGNAQRFNLTDSLFEGPLASGAVWFDGDVDNSIFRNVKFENSVLISSSGGIVTGPSFHRTNFSNCVFGEGTGSASPRGISADSGGSQFETTEVKDCLFQNILIGLNLNNVLDSTISSTKIYCASTRPVGSYGVQTEDLKRTSIKHCDIRDFEVGLRLGPGGGSEVSYSHISHNNLRDVGSGILGPVAGSAGCFRNFISHNHIFGALISLNFGIRMESGQYNVIDSNHLYSFETGISVQGNSGNIAEYLTVKGNLVNFATDGYLMKYLENSTVTANASQNPTRYGFDLSNAVDVMFSGNHVDASLPPPLWPYYLGGASPSANQATRVRGGMSLADNAGGGGFTNPWAAAGDGDAVKKNNVVMYNTVSDNSVAIIDVLSN